MDELEAIRERKLKELMNEAAWPTAPIKTTDANFLDVINKYDVVVIDCWAPWCKPCRAMGPIIDELVETLKGKVAFGKLDTDQNQRTAMRFEIESIPTLLVYKSGKLVNRLVGLRPKEEIIAYLRPLIDKN